MICGPCSTPTQFTVRPDLDEPAAERASGSMWATLNPAGHLETQLSRDARWEHPSQANPVRPHSILLG